jgi:hypothetical protein
MPRLAIIAATAFIALIFAACVRDDDGDDARSESRKTEPPAVVADTIFLGVDFSHATFYDDYVLREVRDANGRSPAVNDLLASKIPSWNNETGAHLQNRIRCRCPLPAQIDLAVSTKANTTVRPEAVKLALTTTAKGDLPAEILADILAPYRSDEGPARGVLLVVQQINKPAVVIHEVIFNRKDGKWVKVEREQRNGHGMGLHSYYLNPLKDAAEHAMKAAAAMLEAKPAAAKP